MGLAAARDDSELDDRKALTRLCVVSRAVRPVGELLRFVAAPDGSLAPDLKRRLPGRGVWVTASRAAFLEAIRRKAFARSRKDGVVAAPDLPDRIDGLIERSALDALSLANKAGLVRAGTAKAEAALASGHVGAILHAKEAAADGVRKFAQAAHRAHGDAGPRTITLFTSVQLDMALGRADVIHAAVVAGPACSGFLDRVAALEFWRDGGLPVPARKAGPARSAGDGRLHSDADPDADHAHPVANDSRVDPEGSQTE